MTQFALMTHDIGVFF